MKADALARLRIVAHGEAVTLVTGTVTPEKRGVTPVTSLRFKNDGQRIGAAEVGRANLATLNADEAYAIEERAGLAADRVPAIYLDAWARMNCEKPFGAAEAKWRAALDDGGHFLDRWGAEAAAMGWMPGDLFDFRAGLAWRLGGVRVEALGTDRVRLSDGQTIELRQRYRNG
jgi:hypothetical protein